MSSGVVARREMYLRRFFKPDLLVGGNDIVRVDKSIMYPRRSWTNAMENLRERKKWSYFKTPPAVAHHGPVHVYR